MDVQLAKQFADLLQQRVEDYYKKYTAYFNDRSKKQGEDKPDVDYHIHERDWQVAVKPGKNYIKIDVGSSGKFMVDENNGLYFIKGYGVIDKKKYFGKLENLVKHADKWWFDGYSIAPVGKAGKYGYAGQITEAKLRKLIRKEIRSILEKK